MKIQKTCLILSLLLLLPACNETEEVNDMCPNGVINIGEECDWQNLDGKTCRDIDAKYTGGTLSCSSTCHFDTTACIEEVIATCNNGALDTGEECDGLNLNAKTCKDIDAKYTGGTLRCSSSCQFDVSACIEEVISTCNNGALDSGEACDGLNLNAKTCKDIDAKYTGGTLSCNSSCQFDVAACSEEVIATCNNGAIDTGEACDGLNLNGKACKDVDAQFTGGKLSCSPVCQFVTTECTKEVVSTCNNGAIDTGEACDGLNLNGKACKDVDAQFTGGKLSCSPVCQFVTTGCTKEVVSKCNNGAIDTGEACDGLNLNGKTCKDVDAQYTGGKLSCSPVCQFVITECTKEVVSKCNHNGSLDSGEECDGQDFGGKVCGDIDNKRAFGQLGCTQNCKISNGWCFANDVGLQSALPDAESTDALCSNGQNDYNTGWYDCRNRWCSMLPIVQVCNSLENTDVLCSNGRDDNMMDGLDSYKNGLTDCDDPSCFKNPRVTVCHAANPVKWELGDDCKDGIDNDDDTLIDCKDLDCLHAGNPCDLGNYKRILFDNAHHQVAGNADWIIDVTGRHPFPTIPLWENDWHGYLSSWGKAIIETGHFVVETLPANRVFTYGSDEPQDLKNYHILISDEPNTNYSASEIRAIYDFVNGGGAFMMLADHAGSDRDGDGWDSYRVFNDMLAKLKAEHGTNPFYFTVMENSDMTTLTAIVNQSQKNHPILKQPHGLVTSVASYAGTAFEILDATKVVTLLTADGDAYAIVGKLGKGRFFAIGDSSISGDSTNSLGATQKYNGFNDKDYNNKTLLMNALEWLALKD